jgi:DNA primase
LRLVKKYTKNLTIIYDGDAAGVKAALRGLDLALEEGLRKAGADTRWAKIPDSYVRKAGHEVFKKFIADHKKDFVLFNWTFAERCGYRCSKKSGAG